MKGNIFIGTFAKEKKKNNKIYIYSLLEDNLNLPDSNFSLERITIILQCF